MMILDPESHQVREVFARYGLAMYKAQCLEKEMGIFLSSAHLPTQNIMSSRYDEILLETLSKTFGGILRTIRDKMDCPPDIEWKLDAALKRRNWLAHDYWWDRSIEFNTPDGRNRMIAELMDLAELFDELDNFFTQHTRAYMSLKGIDEAWIEETMSSMLVQGVTPQIPQPARKLKKKETLINIYRYPYSNDTLNTTIYVFELADHTLYTLCDVGLIHFHLQIDRSLLEPVIQFRDALPAEITPRPKGASDWNYQIPLSTGYEIFLLPQTDNDGTFSFKWGIRKAK